MPGVSDSLPSSNSPSAFSQTLSTIIHLVGVSIISFCIGRRPIATNWSVTRPIASLSIARVAVFAVFLDSWFFLFSTGVLVNGIGLGTPTACGAAIVLCIVFYVTSKLFIYIFLAERVYIVWSAGTSVPRWSSNIYRFCLALLVIYAIIIGAMVFGRVAVYRDDNSCLIGLRSFASIPLLTYDLFLNVFLTSLFIIPILKENFTNTGLRIIAIRTLVAATAALTTSTVNILVLAILKGRELGWVCLACCSCDVALNAIALYWVTAKIEQEDYAMTKRPISIPISIVDPRSVMEFNDEPNTPVTQARTRSWTQTPRRTSLFDERKEDMTSPSSISFVHSESEKDMDEMKLRPLKGPNSLLSRPTSFSPHGSYVSYVSAPPTSPPPTPCLREREKEPRSPSFAASLPHSHGPPYWPTSQPEPPKNRPSQSSKPSLTSSLPPARYTSSSPSPSPSLTPPSSDRNCRLTSHSSNINFKHADHPP